MTDPNLVLYAASYPDVTSAKEDFAELKSAERTDDFAITGAVVMTRDADGKVKVDETAQPVAGGALIGGAVGVVVGLFAPPLLLATAIGAGIGALGGELARKHEEKKLGLELEDVMPAGSSAIIAIVDDRYADRVDKALAKATKKVNKAIDSDDYDKLVKALNKGDKEVIDALNS
jgi:uncharacterized membrane protein